MFTIQVGLASPSLVGIVSSIEMVIYAAVGGRLSLIGAVFGAFLVNGAKNLFLREFCRILDLLCRRAVHFCGHVSTFGTGRYFRLDSPSARARSLTK